MADGQHSTTDATLATLPDQVRAALLERASAAQVTLTWYVPAPAAADRVTALAERLAPALRVSLFVVADRPPDGPAGVNMLPDPALRVHGRLGAVSDAAYVVRPDGYLAFRCDPHDGDWLDARLRSMGVRAATAAQVTFRSDP